MNHLSEKALLLSILFLVSPLAGQNTGHKKTDDTYLKGYRADPEGSDECNPCLDNVIDAVNTLHEKGTTMGFHWGAGYPGVKGAGTPNHWQGVQRMLNVGTDKPYIIVSSSHREHIFTLDGFEYISSPAHFAVVELGSRDELNRRLRSNRLQRGRLTRDVAPHQDDRIVISHIITEEYDHPGGMQAIGKYLLVGSDGNIDHDRQNSLMTVWDMSEPYFPREVWEPRWEVPGINANSLGIVRLEDGRYLMLRALKDAKSLEFYILTDDLENSPAERSVQLWDTWNYPELRSVIYHPDGSLDIEWGDLGSILGIAGYQNTNLVRECETGDIYLLASHGRRPSGFGGNDYLDVFLIDIPKDKPDPDIDGDGVIITKVAKRWLDLKGNSGSRQGDLQAAAGVYVSPEQPLDEIETAEDAWVELFEEKDFQGRSITLDFKDRALRDYDNFRNIEEFDSLATSVIYAIPIGHKLRLYSEINQGGGYLDLVGTDRVRRISDLKQYELDNGQSADDLFVSGEWVEPVLTVRDEEEETAAVPLAIRLYQNYPNPFNPETVIRYEVPIETEIKLDIYDIRGQLVISLVDEEQQPGSYSIKWDGTDYSGQEVASGTYIYRLEIDDSSVAKKLTLLR